MKNHSTVLLRFFMFLVPLGLFAQELPNIVPPSPEAASLGKFTEVPISHYTGLPNISVPIASYEVGGKSFPVSISYHARGISVEEIASRVGIGWALNAGGQISRQTRDQPDDGNGGYINRTNILMDNLSETTINQGFFGDENDREAYRLQDVQTNPNRPDKHPDQFNVQAGGLSAKFIFNYDNDQPLLQSYDDIIIEYNVDDVTMSEQPGGIGATDAIRSFAVTDKDGFKYYFGISKDNNRFARNWDKTEYSYAFPEQTGYAQNATNYDLTFSSWLLMDIESPNGDLVSFIYDEQVSDMVRRSYDKHESNVPLQNGSYDSPYPGERVNYSSKIETHQFQLSEIRYDFDSTGNSYKKIVFEGNDFRQDLDNAKELDAVKVYDENLSLVRTFNLYHSYPATVVDNNQNNTLKNISPPLTTTHASKRVFLDSIVETGINNVSKPPYVFTYNSQKLPHRYSNSQDLWGNYNGAANGQYMTLFGYNNGADRTVNEEKSLAGMLERITYPTGGSTKFIYEHNRGVLGTEYDHVAFPKVNPHESRAEILTHFGNQYYVNNDYYSKDVVVNNVYGLVKFEVDLPTMNGTDHNWACADPLQNDCGFEIKLEGINGAPTYNYIYAGVTEFFVQAGEYRLILNPDAVLNWDPSPGNVEEFEVFMSWQEQPLSESELLYASGKRIKKIEFYDSGNNLVSNKEYSYKNASGEESGVILGITTFGSLNPAFTNNNFNVFELGGAFPGSPFTTYQGNSIGYEMVTEFYGDATNNHGKTAYVFTIHKDTGDFLSYPITPPTNNEWLRGLPKSINHYRRDTNGDYKIVKSISNQYAWGDTVDILPTIFMPESDRRDLAVDITDQDLLYKKTNTSYRLPLIHIYHPYAQDSSGTLDIFDFHYKTYHFTGGTIGKVKTTEALFDVNENTSLISETETDFNYTEHYQPSKVITVTSDGKPVIQTFAYPQELVGSYTVHPPTYSTDPTTALAEQHRFVPLEVKTFKDANDNGVAETSEQTTHTKTVYAWDASHSNILEPIKVQTAKGDNSRADRIEFKDYDAEGNVLQVARTDGMDITYIYGYDKTLPVAKIENATYSQVSSYVANIQNKSNLDDDRCQDSGSCDEKDLRTALNALRAAFPDAMITTYTYDPLIGVTSMTDPRGYTVYYEYDDLHRLVRVKDEDGNIMSENEYHYLLDN